jgi:hypothetical protein
VKREMSAQRTGNVAVEVSCRGKPSGLCATEADRFVIVVDVPHNLFKIYDIDTETLRNMIQHHPKRNCNVNGPNPTVVHLVPLALLEPYFKSTFNSNGLSAGTLQESR